MKKAILLIIGILVAGFIVSSCGRKHCPTYAAQFDHLKENKV